MVKDLFRGSRFDDPPEVHHGDPVRHMPDHGQIVGDEDVGDPELLLEVIEQVQDLCLDGKVQGGHRFIQDDDVRVQGQGPGYADALALAAGEFLRRLAGVRGSQSHHVEQFADPGFAFPRVGYRLRWVAHGSAMMSPAFIRAFREANGSWNTICTRRRQLSSSLPRSPNGFVPSKVTVPASGVSSIIRVRASVDFPQPDSPTRPRVSPVPL